MGRWGGWAAGKGREVRRGIEREWGGGEGGRWYSREG